MPKYHVVRFNVDKNRDLLPWLKAQKSEPTSIAQLIRLAQSIEGDRDWLEVAPQAERKLFSGNNTGNVSKHTRSINEPTAHHINSNSGVSSPHIKTSHTDNEDNASSSINMDLKRNGFNGF